MKAPFGVDNVQPGPTINWCSRISDRDVVEARLTAVPEFVMESDAPFTSSMRPARWSVSSLVCM